MSHTQTKELKKIPLGSMDFYVIPWTGTIPEDSVIENDSNMIGRTKNGATVGYSTEWYVAKSDDGIAVKRKLTGEEATINYGNCTWNANTIKAITSTARVSESGGKRTAKIGGITNDDGQRYLIRGVHRDKIDGDIRITGVGVNTGGWSAVFQNNQETTLQPTFSLEPLDDEGTLLIYEEEILGMGTLNITLFAGSTTGKTKVSDVTPAAESGHFLKYKIGSSASNVSYDDVCTSGWNALTVGTTEIAATADQIITVVEVDSGNKAKKCGIVTVIDNIG